ncbi:hypothetical protein CK203_112297 [Vitis vinifera]|uniref:Uncharacterized protein n=1 Tax=Vitis vinifera TaxID=29760 RepID=A0A438CCK1_VITVI|nr:hypothetical protein CK203_112297 [Vitis vinifera]
MMEMLKGVLCFTDAETPSTKMSDFFPLTKRISEWTVPKTVEVVIPLILPFLFLATLTPSPGLSLVVVAFLERVEADLAAAQKAIADETKMLKLAEGEKKVIRVEADQLKGEKEALEAREGDGGRIFAQKKELKTEYQRQVDEMYFFDYRCCMKKNGIMHGIPSLPSDDEDAIPGYPLC